MDNKKILNNVKASLSIEGLKVSKDSLSITERFLDGNISSQEAIKQILKIYGLKGD
jgi:hypothetical protein